MKHITKLAGIAILASNIAYADGQLKSTTGQTILLKTPLLILRQKQVFR